MLKDLLNLASKLTLRKTLNFAGRLAEYWLSICTGKVFIHGSPPFLTIESTNRCNLHCPACPSGNGTLTRKRGDIAPERFYRILDDCHRRTIFLTLYFQGEPFLHPQIFELIRAASRKKIYTSVSTNGHFLDRKRAENIIHSGLDRLIISVDGITHETYSRYRKGGRLHQVLAGIDRLLETKRRLGSTRPFIIIQSLIFEHNLHQAKQLKEYFRRPGVDRFQMKTAHITDSRDMELLPRNNRYSRYRRDENGDPVLKKKTGTRCRKLWLSTVITQDGMVLPCCFDKNGNHVLGNIEENWLQSIWTGKKYNRFRRQVLHNRENTGICNNCTEGLGKIYY